MGSGTSGPGGRTGRSPRWKSSGLSGALVILVVVLVALQVFGDDGPLVVDLAYSELISEIRAGNIEEILVLDGRMAEGVFHLPVERDEVEYLEFRTEFPGEISDGLLYELEAQGTVIRAKPSDTPWWVYLLSLLPWILIILIFIWIMRAIGRGQGQAFQFSSSKAKLVSPDRPKVTFDDVAGADEAKEELREVVHFLKEPQRFSRLGGKLPAGVLLVGPPGTGKTLIAKAVAGEAGCSFAHMSGSDFVEMFVGVGASRVRDLFEKGKSHAPCIIFIDEIDAVGRHRGAGVGGGHDEREQTLNQLLVEMDGFEANEGVIIIAATNRPDVLDPALLRPGRFDRQVVVGAPDVRGREHILMVHAKKLPLAADVNFSAIAKGTPGFSGADLANLCNEAALLAARRDQDVVEQRDFEAAKDKIMLGVERRSMVLSEQEKRLTAYHEAGHAVVSMAIPGMDPIHKVSIIPRGRALGITASLPEEDRHSHTKQWLEGQLAMFFGGRVAEEMEFGPENVTTGAGNDIERATRIARSMVTRFGMSDSVGLMAIGGSDQEVFLGRDLQQRSDVSEHTAQMVDAEVRRILDEAHSRARDLLSEHRDRLEAIAEALLERETLDRMEVERLWQGEDLPTMAPVA